VGSARSAGCEAWHSQGNECTETTEESVVSAFSVHSVVFHHKARVTLHEDRCFDSDPVVRRAARAVYEETRALPLVCPHGHVDPSLLATDAPFPEPTALLLLPDHYILRMLYSRGLSMESLGVPRRDGGTVETDPRAIWRRFAEHYTLFAGTPTAAWLDYQLHEVFGVRDKLDAASAMRVYDAIAERLRSPEFRPRALYERFNIEVLATTDRATDALEHHRALAASGWKGRMIPTFRPDALLAIAAPGWRDELCALESVSDGSITTGAQLIEALAVRRRVFKSLGATATDHGVEVPATCRLSPDRVESLFARAARGEATRQDQSEFEAHMLMEMARLSQDDGLVMQLHAGSLRNHNRSLFEAFGPDRGADIPVATEYTRNLRPLLDEVGNDPGFTLILFTLDESAYGRELAPLAGHYPAVRLGPPWWFHDSIQGMTRYREQTTETAGFYNTAGFNDDTRAFCSIPARHDLARRVDANFLGGLVACHVIDASDASRIGRALAYDLAREAYRLDRQPSD
jgi:glucuronate isomerase